MQDPKDHTEDENKNIRQENEDQPKAKEDLSELEQEFRFNSGVIPKTEYFDLFISYKRDNGEDHGQVLAFDLYERLTKEGYKVWLDNQEIGFSTDFEKRIELAILHSRKFICIIGPGWVESPNCRFEVIKAAEFGKRIVPIHYQEFRHLLKAKMDEGALTDVEWRKIDKPQEIDFSSKSKYKQGYSDLREVCNLHRIHYHQHTKIMCESFYWSKNHHPKTMLFRGATLSKVKLLKSKCDGDEDLPDFTELQNEFINASEAFVSSEVSNKSNVYVAFDPDELAYAMELDMELKLRNVSTWFEAKRKLALEEEVYQQALISCESVLEVIFPGEAEDKVDPRIVFASSKKKRIIKVTNSREVLKELEEKEGRNVFFWNDQENIDGLISYIKGDRVYNQAHSTLLEQAFQWEKSGKHDSKLLYIQDAYEARTWYLEAEKVGTEPQPGVAMVDFVDRSIAKGETARRRKAMAFWTILTGIVALLFFGIAGTISYFKLTDLKEEAKLVKAEADQAQKDVVKALESMSDAKIIAAQAKDDAKKAEKDVELAMEKVEQAQKDVENAKEDVKEATENAIAAGKMAKDALDQANETRNKAVVDSLAAATNLKKANFKIDFAELKSRMLNLVNASELYVKAAIEFHQLNDEVEAEKAAEQGYQSLRGDMNKLVENAPEELKKDKKTFAEILLFKDRINSIQSQGFYEAYLPLVADSSPFSLVYKDMVREESVVIDHLKNKVNLSPKNSGKLEIIQNGENTVSYRGPDGYPRPDLLASLLEQNKDQLVYISAISIPESRNNMVIGYSNGKIEVWSFALEVVIKMFPHHQPYRITSLAHNFNATQLAVASVDRTLSIIGLNSEGAQNEKDKILFERNFESRILEIEYWNNSTLLTNTWKEKCKVWCTDVDELRAESKKKVQ